MDRIEFNEFKWEIMDEVKKGLDLMKWEIYLANDNGSKECNCLVMEHKKSGWFMKFFLEKIYEEYYEYTAEECTIKDEADSIIVCLMATAEEEGIVKVA